jgi:hypothetical protein
MSPVVFNAIADRHNRFAMFQLWPENAAANISKCTKELGDAFNFTFFNPTGHYVLNLNQPQQREVAKCLLLLNKINFDRVTKGELKDRS